MEQMNEGEKRSNKMRKRGEVLFISMKEDADNESWVKTLIGH